MSISFDAATGTHMLPSISIDLSPAALREDGVKE
jgi:hypothetical protein